MPIELLSNALKALGHDPEKDINYREFLIEHELTESNGTSANLLDFEHYALVVLEYEEKLRIEEEALRQLDFKIAFEFFDLNKGICILNILFDKYHYIYYRWHD